MPATSMAARCGICDRLPSPELLELDTLLGDPGMWPSTVWAFFPAPAGGLPASYRRFGAVRVGRDWLDAHGYADIRDTILRKHIRLDVVHIPRNAEDLVQLGIIRATKSNARLPVAPSLDAGAVIRYFNSGVQVGEAAMRLVAERINRMMDEGKEIDPKLLMKLADLGGKLAVAQAGLQARGAKFGTGDEDEDDAFRGSDAGPRIGHSRMRTIDGEVRPVHDEGPADREAYNRRAREEGSPLLD